MFFLLVSVIVWGGGLLAFKSVFLLVMLMGIRLDFLFFLLFFSWKSL